MKCSEERQQRNFDKILRRADKTIGPAEILHLHIERKTDKDKRHKLVPIVDLQLPVTNVDKKSKNFIIELPGRFVDTVSRKRVVPTPPSKSTHKPMVDAQPMKLTEIVSDFHFNEEQNLRNLQEHLRELYFRQNGAVKPYPDSTETEPQTTATSVTEQYQETPADPTSTGEINASEHENTTEYVINHTIAHKANRSRRHNHAEHWLPLYPIRWYRYGPADDIWEPVSHLPQNNILSYHNNKKIPRPRNLDGAIDG